jgi:hypothetical protein
VTVFNVVGRFLKSLLKQNGLKYSSDPGRRTEVNAQFMKHHSSILWSLQFWIDAQSLVVFEDGSGRASARSLYSSAFLRISQEATCGRNSEQDVNLCPSGEEVHEQAAPIKTAAVVEGSFGQAAETRLRSRKKRLVGRFS